MNLKGTKTEANLMAAFAGESQARNKYTYYASKAKKDGYEFVKINDLIYKKDYYIDNTGKQIKK